MSWMTATQVAEQLGLSVHTVRDAAEEGRLSGVKTGVRGGGQWRFRQADVDNWMESGRRHAVTPLRRRTA